MNWYSSRRDMSQGRFAFEAVQSAGMVAQSGEMLLTPKEVAKRLGVSVDWVQAHATRKHPRIDHIRAGKLIRFTAQQVDEFIRRQAVTHAR